MLVEKLNDTAGGKLNNIDFGCGFILNGKFKRVIKFCSNAE